MSEQKNSGAEIQEPSLFQKIIGMIFVGDLGSAVKSSLTKVVGPKFNDLIATALKYIVDGIFKGNQTASPSVQQDSRIQSTLFSQYWSGTNGQAVNKIKTHDVQRPMSQDIWFPTKDEAVEVYLYMVELCRTQGHASVNQLFDKANLTVPHTAVGWGWKDFSAKAKIVGGTNRQGVDGYILSTGNPVFFEQE